MFIFAESFKIIIPTDFVFPTSSWSRFLRLDHDTDGVLEFRSSRHAQVGDVFAAGTAASTFAGKIADLAFAEDAEDAEGGFATIEARPIGRQFLTLAEEAIMHLCSEFTFGDPAYGAEWRPDKGWGRNGTLGGGWLIGETALETAGSGFGDVAPILDEYCVIGRSGRANSIEEYGRLRTAAPAPAAAV